MSYLLEMLAKGLECGVAETLSSLLRRGAPRSEASGSKTSEPLEPFQAACAAGEAGPERRRQMGLACLEAMQVEQAIDHLTAACRACPDDVHARLALAAACDEAGRSGESLEHLRAADEGAPGNPLVLFAIGYCLEKLQRPAEAAAYYRDAIAGDPGCLSARRRLAAIAMTGGDGAEAVAQYEALRHSRPEDTDIRATLAHLYHAAGRHADAVAEFEHVIALEPENWALLDEEVETLIAAGQFREALERLRRLIDAQGPTPDLCLRLADVLSRCGEDGEAVASYLSALEGDPGYIEARIGLGTHHLFMGRWADAAEAFAQAAEVNDRLLTCYVGLAVAQAGGGQREQAIGTLQLAATVEPNSSLLLSEVARLQLKAAAAEQFDAAFPVAAAPPMAEPDLDNDDLLHVQIARHAEQVGRNPEYADLRYRYGVLLRADGRLDEAREQFANAVRINPAYVDAIIRLGVTCHDLGQIDQAVKAFQDALRIKPEYVDLHYRLALLYTDRRQFAEAVRHMETAAGLAPGNAQVHAALALSLQNMGLMDRSAATWRSLCQMHRQATEPRGD